MGALSDPTLVKARATSDTTIALTWTDNATGEVYYKVERKTGAGTYSTLSSTVAANAATYADTGLTTSTQYTYRVTALATTQAEIQEIECVAESAGIDGTYFILYEDDGAGGEQSRALWIDVDDSGTAEPVHGADVSTEITTITAGMTADQVASAIQAVINGLATFSASVLTDTITATSSISFLFTNADEGTSGFTITTTQEGNQNSDSAAVESNAVYTQPDSTGEFLGAFDGDTDWTLFLKVTGTAPFLKIQAWSIVEGNSMSQLTQPDPDTILWSEALSPSTFPY